MKYLFHFSGENLDLALAELHALLEVYSLKFKVLKDKETILIVESRATEEHIEKLSKRSALLKSSSVLIYTAKSLLLKEFEKVKWSEWVKPPFCVRVEDLSGPTEPGLEGRLASPIWWAIKNPSVDLNNPKTTVYIILNKKATYITKLIWKKQSGRFKGREPSEKPAFHPTALKPKLARLLVNLARAKESFTMLDPFCGTASIPIEAAVLGCRVIGSDIDKIMVKGAKTNLEFYKKLYKYKDYKVLQANALELEKNFAKNSIDAIATDPPYGRSSFVGAKSLKDLYKDFLVSSQKILKQKSFMTLVYPNSIKVEPMISRKNWKIIDRGEWFVHGGLTRKILILRKI